MFGLKYLRNYVGEIVFFGRFPWAIETNSLREVSVGTAEEDELLASAPRSSCTDWAMTCNLFVGSRQLDAARDPRLEVVLPQLCRRCQTLSAWDITSRRYDEMQKVQNESKSIAHSLGAGLLNYIWTTFDFASVGIEHSSIDVGRCIEYDRQLDFHSMVREIEVLQAKLNATEDEDEQRALEEDVTGKILWLCWCGICAEVDQLLPQVADYIRSERKFVVSGVPRLTVAMSPPSVGITGNLKFVDDGSISKPKR
ncbi:hypothetical protein BKA82DRAFT_403843 [Pisolithus tinctorius]|uniref:Uncharacterized protein n=1 Tax=Pisolithus tinctorius Marx 270 TaxID=870435 RepID=A0A0C3NFC9_PISTI|nr:hypothetical protein BKA82DRAFT_403843 [Pisolithus tinctorius]KIN94218.1 hypothetical protein M404DRAFT_403843 [Pisolithus tinctorius Marx 270]